jgi:ParB family chromosome partitioning protein
MSPDDLVIVGLDGDDPTDTKALFDERIHLPLDGGMVKNIMVYGVLEPVLVTKIGDVAYVVDGRQRVRCAREANIRLEREGKEPVRVPVMVKRGGEATLFGISLSANENRQDDGPLAKATKCQRYLDMGRSEAEAAVAFGVTKKTIGMWLRLLELDPKVRKAVEAQKLSPTAASHLANLSPEKQRETLAKLLANGKPTVAAAKTARKTNGAATHSRPTRQMIRRVIETKGDLREDFLLGVRWAAGDLDSTAVRGLVGILGD